MALSRYAFAKRIDGGKAVSSVDTFKIYSAVERGIVNYQVITLEEGQRLDHIAGLYYDNSSLWWIIAAASGIGWNLQCPPGTILRIPTRPQEVYRLLA
jgi:hypothetical protein